MPRLMILHVHSSHFNPRLLITTIYSANMWRCNYNPAFYSDDAANFNPGKFLEAWSTAV